MDLSSVKRVLALKCPAAAAPAALGAFAEDALGTASNAVAAPATTRTRARLVHIPIKSSRASDI
jgi:hypothetical protein